MKSNSGFSLGLKLLMLGVVVIVLTGALKAIESKIYERTQRRDSVIRQLAAEYAGAQEMSGPLLVFECRTKVISKVTKKIESESCATKIIRPTTLTVKGHVEPDQRRRGIYQARTFDAALEIAAEFRVPRMPHHDEVVTYHEPTLVFAISDVRGIREFTVTDSGDNSLNVEPGFPATMEGHRGTGVHLSLNDRIPVDGGSIQLRSRLRLAGSGTLAVVPLGEVNNIALDSPWPHPSFIGSFLPTTRTIAPDGFNAQWVVSDLATGGENVLARMGLDGSKQSVEQRYIQIEGVVHPAATFGSRPVAAVALVEPIDQYTLSDRAVRYGFLFVLLTLGSVFLFEILKSARVHPVQYLLAGLAVTVFFILLFALSEHLAFVISYLAAATACALLLAYYAMYMLKSLWRGCVFGLGIALLYGALYFLLTLEDTAFLIGAVMTFVALAAAMILTRKIDWYALGESKSPPLSLPSATASAAT